MNIKYMKRALILAKKGVGKVFPNPMVGAVLVRGGRIVGEGYHQYFGGLHAEVNAIASAGGRARGADLYVSLEPCDHYGKTPPCTKAIIAAGIKKVYTAMSDPNPLVAGKGIVKLRKNGLKVYQGYMEQEAKALNRDYLHYITRNRPYVICKWAMSADGKLATKTGDSKWISNQLSLKFAHKLRNQVDAVVVGINTVLKDDPRLTVRLLKAAKNPTRIVMDSRLQIPIKAKILNNEAKTIIVCGKGADTSKAKKLMKMGVEVWQVKDLHELMRRLAGRGLARILVEGGGQTHAGFIEAGLVDKIVAIIAPLIIGGRQAVTPVAGNGVKRIKDALKFTRVKFTTLEDNVVMEGEI